MHHKGRNKHHFEYWTDYDPITKVMSGVKMPLRYVVEMFCDRVAAGKTYRKGEYNNTYPLAYYQRGSKNRTIHPDTEKLLGELLTILAEKGEDEAFAHIRALLKKGTY